VCIGLTACASFVTIRFSKFLTKLAYLQLEKASEEMGIFNGKATPDGKLTNLSFMRRLHSSWWVLGD
jgi:hypothetical protein